MSMNDYLEDEDAQPETDDSEPSTTYIEFSSRDHPEAYKLASQGGAIRGTFSGRGGPSINDFYAGLTEALGATFTEGDKVPLLKFAEPTEDEVKEYLEWLQSQDE